MIRRGFQVSAGRSALTAKNFLLLIPIVLMLAFGPGRMPEAGGPAAAISRAAADSCSLKVKELEDFAAKNTVPRSRTTRLTQNEINSYLALDLSSKYSPALKSLQLTLEETNRLQAVALIDFDKLEMTSAKPFTHLIANMFSGIHQLNLRGNLIAQAGKASFQLGEARFDGSALPGFLVEEVITAVCRKQNPPFDPLRPTQMPYLIEQVDGHSGYILIQQRAPQASPVP